MNIVKRLKDSLEYEYNLSFNDRKHLLEEIDRLNNIINELEKWIKENNLGKYRTENVVDTDELLDKLKELKKEGNK